MGRGTTERGESEWGERLLREERVGLLREEKKKENTPHTVGVGKGVDVCKRSAWMCKSKCCL